MILVQNLHLPLNGNKITFILVVMCLLVVSCKPKQKLVNDRSTRVITNNTTKAKSKVDTIQWTEEILVNEISKMTDQPVELKDQYKIALFIPFNTGNYNSNDFVKQGSSEIRFANYYNGIKMALENLKQEGANFYVNVFDSDSENFEAKLNQCTDYDVVIGPYSRNRLKTAADFCKKNEIVNISPWQASSKITSDNPFHVQLRPNQTDYYEAILQDAITKYSAEQIFLLGRPDKTDRGRIGYFQKMASAMQNLPKGQKPLNEYSIELDSLDNEALTYDKIFIDGDVSVFILPQWSSEDEGFLYDCLRKLAIEKTYHSVVVYGMPIMIDSDRISFDYFQNLNIKVARAKWVDRTDPKVQSFRSSYFQRFNALPVSDALDGYDMMLYIGRNLVKDGKTFQFTLDQDRERYLQTAFDVQKVMQEGEERLDNFNNINYFQNRQLDIISFERDRLIRN